MRRTSSPDHATRIRRTFAWRSALVFAVVGIATQLVTNANAHGRGRAASEPVPS